MDRRDVNLSLVAEAQALLLSDVREVERGLSAWERGFPCPESDATRTTAWLEQFSSALNAGESRWVTDPWASDRKITGSWWNSSVRYDAGSQMCVQRFLGGVRQSADQAYSRMTALTSDPATEFLSFTQVWPAVDPDYADEIEAALALIETVTNPVASGETWAGTFACGPTQMRENDDGTITVSRRMTQVTTATTAAGLASVPFRVYQGNVIRDPLAIADVGDDATPEVFSEVDISGSVDTGSIVFSGLTNSDAVRTALMQTVTAANLESQFTGSGKTFTGTGWRMAERQFRPDPETNAAMFSVVFTKATWFDIPGAASASQVHDYAVVTSVTVDVQGTPETLGIIRVWERMGKTTRDRLLAAGGEAVSDVTIGSEVFSHVEHREVDHRDGSYTITQRAANQGDTGENNVLWYESFDTEDYQTETRVGVVYEKTDTHSHIIAHFTDDRFAAMFIQGRVNDSGKTVSVGSIRISKVSEFKFRAEWDEVTWGTWAVKT